MPTIKPFRALRLSPERINHSEQYTVPDRFTVSGKETGGLYVADPEERYYILRMIREGHEQTGIIACVAVEGYRNGTVKRHELIRPAKVDLQMWLIGDAGGNTEPALLAFEAEGKPVPPIGAYADSHPPLYDFAGTDDTIHQLWAVEDAELAASLGRFFQTVDTLYICDGHHRIAASAAYDDRFRTAESRWFMAAIFPAEEMLILDFNRAVSDLNGLSKEELLGKLAEESFEAECVGGAPYRPAERGEYAMVIDDTWYRLRYTGTRVDDPVASLDVSILQNRILGPILGIDDPTHDERITFLRGMRGLAGLQAMTHRGMKVAFALSPVTMKEIFAVANAGLTMPPKSTCFEPKPVKNLLVHPIPGEGTVSGPKKY